MKMNRKSSLQGNRNEHGAIFLLAIVTLVVMLILGASLIQRAQTALRRATVENRSTQSFHLAEAGVNKATWALNQPNGWLTYSGESRTSIGGGFFEATVTPAPSDRGVFTDRLTVLGTGYLPAPNNGKRMPRRVRCIVHKDPRYFAYAVFGNDSVKIGNGTVTVLANSYTSDNGGYGGTNVAENADVGTNSTAAGAVEILPKGEVHGNIIVGAGAGSPQQCVNNKGTITGTISSASAGTMLPSIKSIPSGIVNLGDVWLEGSDQLVLNAGTYRMTDLDMFGSAQIICNGKVVIYLDESSDPSTPDIRIGGNGFVNTSHNPADLVVYCADDVVDIDISGNGIFYGGIYAPKATIHLNSGELYGSVIGRRVEMNGATSHVHYDQALRDHANPRAIVWSWEEL